MKKLILVLVLMITSQVHADYGYIDEGDQASHERAERIKRNNNINSDYNSATPNPSNYHRDQGFGMKSVN